MYRANDPSQCTWAVSNHLKTLRTKTEIYWRGRNSASWQPLNSILNTGSCWNFQPTNLPQGFQTLQLPLSGNSLTSLSLSLQICVHVWVHKCTYTPVVGSISLENSNTILLSVVEDPKQICAVLIFILLVYLWREYLNYKNQPNTLCNMWVLFKSEQSQHNSLFLGSHWKTMVKRISLIRQKF